MDLLATCRVNGVVIVGVLTRDRVNDHASSMWRVCCTWWRCTLLSMGLRPRLGVYRFFVVDGVVVGCSP